MAQTRLTPQQIAQMARARGYDPQAVLAVARQEGLSGGVGDGGHAYGPFQLNDSGGAITKPYGGRVNDPSVQDWAWSPQGVAYALDRMGAAKGLRGPAAIKAIVSQFERPANPGREIANALAAYGANPGSGGAPGGEASAPPAAAAGTPVPPGGGAGRAGLVKALLAASQSGDYGGFFGQVKAQRAQPVQAPGAPAAPMVGPGIRPPGGPIGQVVGGQGENPDFLARLAALAGVEHAPVNINSGYRSYQKQAELYANRASNPNPVAAPGHSLHEQGLAADGTVGGVPLGKLPAALLARFGLETVPGDPVHVQLARR